MIRFVPVGEAIYPAIPEYYEAFAWWSTVRDTFFTFYGCQVWKTWAEFESDFRVDHTGSDAEDLLARFKSLYGNNDS